METVPSSSKWFFVCVCVCDDLYGVGFVFIRVILQIVPEQFA